MNSKGLGFFPGSVDERDYELRPSLARIVRPRTQGGHWWFNPMRLDQGAEGACVGFGWTQNANSSPSSYRHSNDEARQVYYRARQLDEWPGEDYDGTSVRAGAKSVLEKGWIQSYAFTYDVEEIAMWLLNKGPVTIGVDWHEGMDNPVKENNYYIRVEGRIRGGHCTLLDGVRWNGNERDYFRGLNSWGREWGMDGRFRISVPDLDKLLKADSGVAATAVEQ